MSTKPVGCSDRRGLRRLPATAQPRYRSKGCPGWLGFASLLLVVSPLALGFTDHRIGSFRWDGASGAETVVSREDLERVGLVRDTQVLIYSLGDQQSTLTVIGETGATTVPLPPRSVIESVATRVYGLLSHGYGRGSRGQLTLGLAELSELILDPVAGVLTAERLIIVADGVLRRIPFSVLPVPGSSQGRRDSVELPLLTYHRIVTLPSLDILRQARERGPANHGKTLAVIADPVFSVDDPRVAQGVETRPHARRDKRDTEMNRWGLRRLPRSAEEGRAILDLVPPSSRLAAVGFGANLDLVFSGGLADFQIIHFATHAVRGNAGLDGLALSFVDEDGNTQPGLLAPADIRRLDLRADLVVLSACETGLGAQRDGGGLSELAESFFVAGARGVVISLWRVEDEATAQLMETFYRTLLSQGLDHLDAAAALRAAQLAMMQEKAWASPYYWGGFEFQGY